MIADFWKPEEQYDMWVEPVAGVSMILSNTFQGNERIKI